MTSKRMSLAPAKVEKLLILKENEERVKDFLTRTNMTLENSQDSMNTFQNVDRERINMFRDQDSCDDSDSSVSNVSEDDGSLEQEN